jgi:hypothetical protein
MRDQPPARSRVPLCPRCWLRVLRPIRFTPDDYAELLGLYLGDGYVVRTGRTQRLRLFLDSRYHGIVEDARALLSRSFPSNSVGLVRAHAGAMTVVSVYCSHLACLFPQHGPGKKHERRIELEPWQEAHVETAPWAFLRGCIRSDGCVFINRTGPYRYLSYEFCNSSPDIRSLFTWTCDLVGVEYRVNGNRIRMCRRRSAELLLQNIGRKE